MREFDYGQLRLLRRARKLKQADVAKVLCVTAATVSNMENGKVKVPAEDIMTLANFYEVDVGTFFKERLSR